MSGISLFGHILASCKPFFVVSVEKNNLYISFEFAERKISLSHFCLKK